MAQTHLDVGIGNVGQTRASGAAGRDGGQAFLGVAAVFLEVACHKGIDNGPIVSIEVATSDEVVGQRPGLVERPGLEGGHQLDLGNQAVLQRKQAEEQVAVNGDSSQG